MNPFWDLMLGAYEPFLKAITINEEIIEEFEKKNPDTLKTLVAIHENFHWLQLNSSSIGHLISFIPIIHSRIALFATETPKFFGRNLIIKKPLIESIDQYTEDEIRMMKNDLKSLELVQSFFMDTNDYEVIKESFKEYNQALFSFFDQYLMICRDIISDAFCSNTYDAIVKANRDFWDSDKNNVVFKFAGYPLIGFKDLIECAARIVEIKYYSSIIESNNILGIDKSIDTSYFNGPSYTIPFKYVSKLFNENITDKHVMDFLLLSIHIAINPSIVPFYSLAYLKKNSLFNIHPGMRFYLILTFIKNKYHTIQNAMDDPDIHKIIIDNLEWDSDQAQFEDYCFFYKKNYEKIKKKYDKDGLKKNNDIFDIDYIQYRHYLVLELKSKHPQYFIDLSNYLSDKKLLPITLDLGKKLYPPVVYNTNIDKYQMNLSGIAFSEMSRDGDSKELGSTKRIDDQDTIDEFVNYLFIWLQYDLDNQLLTKSGDFDYSSLDYFDINDEGKDQLIQFYKTRRGIIE